MKQDWHSLMQGSDLHEISKRFKYQGIYSAVTKWRAGYRLFISIDIPLLVLQQQYYQNNCMNYGDVFITILVSVILKVKRVNKTPLAQVD